MDKQERWRQMNAFGLEKAKEYMIAKGWVFKPIEHPRFNFEVGDSRNKQLLKVATRNHTNSDGSVRNEFKIYHNPKQGEEAMAYADDQHAEAIWILYVINAPNQTASSYAGLVGDLHDLCRVEINEGGANGQT